MAQFNNLLSLADRPELGQVDDVTVQIIQMIERAEESCNLARRQTCDLRDLVHSQVASSGEVDWNLSTVSKLKNMEPLIVIKLITGRYFVILVTVIECLDL